jgi:hypothetical protein
MVTVTILIFVTLLAPNALTAHLLGLMRGGIALMIVVFRDQDLVMLHKTLALQYAMIQAPQDHLQDHPQAQMIQTQVVQALVVLEVEVVKFLTLSFVHVMVVDV